ncbi:MAG: response regulator [Rhodobacteraceae bacterium]|nr:response regulator [Paracoccaceae bacterium]
MIEDGRFTQKLLARALRAISVGKVIAAINAETALFNLERDPNVADVALLDFSLPGMNGLAFLEKVRRHRIQQIRRFPVIVVTGHNDMNLYLKMSSLGISGFLLKPASKGALSKALENALSGYLVGRKGPASPDSGGTASVMIKPQAPAAHEENNSKPETSSDPETGASANTQRNPAPSKARKIDYLT